MLMAKRKSEELRDQIEELIAFGKLPPGTHLDETELAERFGVSRTPIREAFNQLASNGVIEILPRRGAFVPRFGAEELVEMFEVMAELEGMCGRLAARRLTEAERAELAKVHEESRTIVEEGDPDDYYALNDRFHGIIYEGCHNSFLMEQVWNLRKRLRPYRRLQLRVRGRIMSSFQEHEQIVQAINEGNGQQAEELLRGHVAVQGERFGDLVANLNRVFPTNSHA